MKSIKKISLMLVAAFTLGGVAMANEAPKGKRNMDPKVHVEKMTERMVKEYGLNDSQKQQLLDLNQTFAEKMGNRPGAPNRHGKKGKPGDMAKAPGGDKDKANKEGNIAKENRERRNKEQARADRPERKERADRPKPTAEEREKRMQEMKQVRDNYNAQLQKIMNADQYQAYSKKQVEREQKRKEQVEKSKANRSKRSASDKAGKQV